MLNHDTTICNECFHYLAKKSTKSAKTWLGLCQFASINPHHLVFGSMQEDKPAPTLEFLEQEGFLISTEINTASIVIKMLGYDNQQDMFCIKKHSLE